MISTPISLVSLLLTRLWNDLQKGKGERYPIESPANWPPSNFRRCRETAIGRLCHARCTKMLDLGNDMHGNGLRLLCAYCEECSTVRCGRRRLDVLWTRKTRTIYTLTVTRLLLHRISHKKECNGFHGISKTDTTTKIQYPSLQQTTARCLVSSSSTLDIRRVETNTLDR